MTTTTDSEFLRNFAARLSYNGTYGEAADKHRLHEIACRVDRRHHTLTLGVSIEHGVKQVHSHYAKPIPPGATHIDVYRVCEMFNVTSPAIQHALKKLLVAGRRGAGKTSETDVQEAIDSLQRHQAMREEDVTVTKNPVDGVVGDEG